MFSKRFSGWVAGSICFANWKDGNKDIPISRAILAFVSVSTNPTQIQKFRLFTQKC